MLCWLVQGIIQLEAILFWTLVPQNLTLPAAYIKLFSQPCSGILKSLQCLDISCFIGGHLQLPFLLTQLLHSMCRPIVIGEHEKGNGAPVSGLLMQILRP